MKTNPGRFFEDFRLGETIRHATPRTITVGDGALYTALYGSRFAVQSADAFAGAVGYPRFLTGRSMIIAGGLDRAKLVLYPISHAHDPEKPLLNWVVCVKLGDGSAPPPRRDLFAERAPDGFTDIDQVATRAELAAIVGGYSTMAGFDRDQVNRQR